MTHQDSDRPTTLLYRPHSYIERLDLSSMFAAKQPLEVELGSGDGSFLAAYAANHPEHNFIGVERLLGRMRKLDRKGLRAGLTNLRLIRLEASYVLEFLLPPESVRAFHLYFPDPWPKRRHHKKRLVTPRFAEFTRQALEPDGAIYLRTDDESYFQQMTAVFSGHAGFKAIATPSSLGERLTDFERDFREKGIPTLAAAYQRIQ